MQQLCRWNNLSFSPHSVSHSPSTSQNHKTPPKPTINLKRYYTSLQLCQLLLKVMSSRDGVWCADCNPHSCFCVLLGGRVWRSVCIEKFGVKLNLRRGGGEGGRVSESVLPVTVKAEWSFPVFILTQFFFIFPLFTWRKVLIQQLWLDARSPPRSTYHRKGHFFHIVLVQVWWRNAGDMLDESNFPLRLLFSLLFCIYANLTEERNCFDFFLDLKVVFNPVTKFKITWKKSRETTLLLFKRN